VSGHGKDVSMANPHTSARDDAHKLVIIGSGPAGWTAAIYAARAQLAPVVYSGVAKQDPGPVLPGGQLMLTTEVENYPGFSHGITGPKMMDEFQKQAERFGTRNITEDIIRCDFSTRPFTLETSQDGRVATGQIRAHSVILATGAVANWLGLDNEMRLARAGGGVSACAVCDGALPVFRDQTLVVVGGGDTAMEEATYLTKFGKRVIIVHRRDHFRASKIMQDRFLSRHNAQVMWNKVVVDVFGENLIEGVEVEDTVTKQRSRLDCKGLFIAIGHTPATKFLFPPDSVLAATSLEEVRGWFSRLDIREARGAAAKACREHKGTLPPDWSERFARMVHLYHKPSCPYVELDAGGYVVLGDRSSRTNIDGVFAAGDIADPHYRQAVTAAGMGCQAALDAERWLAAKGVH
jgi:thioredoxin reductase (NADPH)